MTTYYDHYFDAADANAFLPLLASQPNIIGPVFGQEAVGANPARVYIAVRSTVPLPLPDGAAVTNAALGMAQLGVWA